MKSLFTIMIVLLSCCLLLSCKKDESNPTQPTMGILLAPIGVSATAGNCQVTVNWTAATGATSYNIYWSTSSGVTKTSGTKIAGATSPYAHTGCTNWTTYYYIVTALNSSGESVESSQVSATPSTPGAAPSTPTGVTATAGNGQVTVSWTAATGAASYNIYWSTTSGVTKANGTRILAVASPYTHTGRTNATTYYYIITAVNSSGESVESSQVSATPAGGSVWNIETVSPAGSMAEYPSLAIDNDGNPHVSYVDGVDGYLKHAFKSGTTWTIENVEYIADALGTDPYDGVSSIALDAANNPHICYFSALGWDPTYGTGSTNFKYTRKVGGSWKTTIIPLAIDPHGYGPYLPFAECSIAVDKTTGTAHVSLHMSGGWGYALGYWNTSLARGIVVDNSDGDPGRQNAIALDGNGFPNISYEAGTAPSLKYAHWNGSAFNLETVAPLGLVYWESRLTSLAIDKSNNPHIAYYGQGGYNYASKNGSSWTNSSIPRHSSTPSLSLCLDGTGQPLLALEGEYAYWIGSSWSLEIVEGNVGHSAIAVDNSGRIHIVYNTSSGILKHASK